MSKQPIAKVVFATKDFDKSLEVLNSVRGVICVLDPDRAFGGRFVVTTTELRKMLLAIKQIASGPEVMREPELVQFAIACDRDGEMECYAFGISRVAVQDFYDGLLAALDAQNEVGQARITQQAKRIVPWYRRNPIARKQE